MSAASVAQLLAGEVAVGNEVVVKGWVRTRRDSKAGFSFVHVSDGSSFDPIQVVADTALANYEDEIRHLTSGCAIVATGELVDSKGKGQSVEVQARNVEVVGWVEDPDTYPVQPKRHSFEFLREVAHLRPRTNTFGAVTRVRHRIAQAIHRYFDEHGYYWVNTPIITASDCEGAGELFRVSTLDAVNPPMTDGDGVDYREDFFGRETYLTVSGQLNVEAYCLSLSKVYTFGPTFRAENSNTSRHLAEFWMIEPEIAFADLGDLADLAEDFLRSIFREVLASCERDMAFFAQFIEKDAIKRLERFDEQRFARLDYSEAIKALSKVSDRFEFPVKWGLDLQTEHERYLCEVYAKRPVVVMNYPKEIKAFYMRMNDDEKTVAALDVLAPGIGEIIGGSQREDDLDVLVERIREHELPEEFFQWYLDLRRYGSVPHSGFGLGLERTVAWICGIEHVREAIPFPRMMYRIEP